MRSFKGFVSLGFPESTAAVGDSGETRVKRIAGIRMSEIEEMRREHNKQRGLEWLDSGSVEVIFSRKSDIS